MHFRVKENTFLAPPASKVFPYTLGNPAQRALARAGITTLPQLAKFTENQIRGLHGLGPAAIVQLREDLKIIGKSFAKG